jgi:hypothetical protein
MNYSWPVMIAGLAFIVNQTLDRQFLKYLLPEEEARHQIECMERYIKSPL